MAISFCVSHHDSGVNDELKVWGIHCVPQSFDREAWPLPCWEQIRLSPHALLHEVVEILRGSLIDHDRHHHKAVDQPPQVFSHVLSNCPNCNEEHLFCLETHPLRLPEPEATPFHVRHWLIRLEPLREARAGARLTAALLVQAQRRVLHDLSQPLQGLTASLGSALARQLSHLQDESRMDQRVRETDPLSIEGSERAAAALGAIKVECDRLVAAFRTMRQLLALPAGAAGPVNLAAYTRWPQRIMSGKSGKAQLPIKETNPQDTTPFVADVDTVTIELIIEAWRFQSALMIEKSSTENPCSEKAKRGPKLSREENGLIRLSLPLAPAPVLQSLLSTQSGPAVCVPLHKLGAIAGRNDTLPCDLTLNVLDLIDGLTRRAGGRLRIRLAPDGASAQIDFPASNQALSAV